MNGCCAVGLSAYIPGANIYHSGAVPAGTVVSVYGAHLQKQATVDPPTTADAGPFTFPATVSIGRP